MKQQCNVLMTKGKRAKCLKKIRAVQKRNQSIERKSRRDKALESNELNGCLENKRNSEIGLNLEFDSEIKEMRRMVEINGIILAKLEQDVQKSRVDYKFMSERYEKLIKADKEQVEQMKYISQMVQYLDYISRKNTVRHSSKSFPCQ